MLRLRLGRSLSTVAALVAGAWFAPGCGDECVTGLPDPASCTPLYAPTFNEIHARTLRGCVLLTCSFVDTRIAA